MASNGTQRAFNDDPSVLYISLHRYEQGTFYPCGPFGSLTSCGEGPGTGFSVNVPWPCAGMGDAEYIYAFQKVILPIATEFAPELVISKLQSAFLYGPAIDVRRISLSVSAGFDAAAGDELGECLVSPAGYAHMTHMLAGLAGGRMVVALEGGYNLDSISQSALAVTKVLLGEPPDELPPLKANEEGTETVWLVAREQSKYWKSVDPKACEPQADVEPISFSVPEILKAHRQHYLYTKHDMMQVPMMTPELEEKFSSQIMCTSDIFESKTLVIFVHEFGNLRLELESSTTCDVHLERSYLIDFSKELVGWVKSEGYSLLDANLYPKPSTTPTPNLRHKTMEEVGRDVLVYLWDNYVQLSGAERVILIGHGPGCKPLVDLLNRRTTSVTKSAKAIIQVVGSQRMPSYPSDVDDARPWYQKSSLVIVPQSHPVMGPHIKPKDIRRHGVMVPIDETRQIKLITRALPAIKQFVQETLSSFPLANRTNRP
ncbi:Histone deacetylase clr3 [Psilocybe cubensis]|uniref:histone deacetylase n=2 Tax=Psilocybe cubensis TaxID=181762 RepID=A0A8H7Y3H6_PSICU|nr:Histone deacetylase clr3 [Psilocybe cubensis]KAH9481512.1 Histone deacetylase clr3 [Psilocybe cubensis]